MAEPYRYCIVCGREQGRGKRRKPWHESTHLDGATPLPWCPECLAKHHPRLVELYEATTKREANG